jgi:hypothetical protein
MNKEELRKMVREEVRKELYEILPQLISEAIRDVLAQGSARPPAKRRVVAESRKPRKPAAPLDRTKLAAMFGYGDMKPGLRSAAVPPIRKIAGVPVVGGLMEHELAAGVAHLRDYNTKVSEAIPSEVDEAYDPQFTNIPAMPAGAEVPAQIVQALGKNAKKVLEAAEQKSNWRPGMKSRS